LTLSAGSRVFRASWFWTFNIIVGVTSALVGSILVPILFDFFYLRDSTSQLRLELWCLWGINILIVFLVYFPGNLGVFWPYAVEIDSLVGIVLRGPLKRVSVPFAELGEIEDSLFWQGFVIHLTKPRGALTQFIIPWYFGSRRKALVDAIRQANSQ
jgi:hypothetical protein